MKNILTFMIWDSLISCSKEKKEADINRKDLEKQLKWGKAFLTVIFLFGISYLTFSQKDDQPEAKSVQNRATYGLKPGYKGILEIGYGIPAGENGESRVKLSFINGIQFNPYISLGIGTGLFESYDAELIPVFADFRIYPLNEKTSPYFAFDMGCSFGSGGSSGGGFMWSIIGGLNLNLSRNFSMHLGVGYDSQKLNWYDSYKVYPSPGASYVKTVTYSGMSGAVLFILGCSF